MMRAIGITVGILAVVGALIWQPSVVWRTPYAAPDATSETWEEILDNPREISVDVVSTGIMETDLSGIMNLDHESAASLEDAVIDIPVTVGVVHHRDRGVYLVDAGLDASYAEYEFGTMRGLLVEGFLGRGSQEPGQHIAAVLHRDGVELQGVFLTHLHFDHTAGIVDLPKDIPYVVGEGEPYRNYRFIIQGDHLSGIRELQEIEFDDAVDLPPLGQSVDLFGDGSFWAISSAGHSPAHVLYFVNGIDGQYLLTGDACNNAEQFDTAIGPGFYSSDVEAAQIALERIIEFSEMYPQVTLVFGHDLETR